MASRLLLLALAAAVVFSDDVYFESHLGDRSFFCRDRYGFIGDCGGGRYNGRPDFDYGYPEAGGGGGRKVGMGHFNFVGNRHGELVCDFLRDGGVSDDLSNIVWRKIYSDPGGWQYNYRRGRGADLRGRPRYHGGYNRRSRFHDFFGGRGRYSDGRGSWHGHRGQGFRRSFDDDWSGDRSGEDFGHHNWRRYDHLRSGDFYGRPRHISGYTDWYTNDDFYSSTRVYTQGSRSTLYIRDFRPADFGRYRCYATRRGSFPYREETVYMDVDFRPRQRFV